ncbi:LPS export ABC transporter permease LptG [Azohydromonas caseinilytica]|uniref:LPS export ABC transporter permease LptG n=1 Tax=Azohydromonas caseinilytica TaxID=2728836 RepID=A0A848FGT1_9BURK|nr:LPS export ABC transporter permease LptG [Azohydromonas caseinilytica]NML17463.1 LPS export ABC transporter permease LptG [Azohydromonas caseinilytica]
MKTVRRLLYRDIASAVFFVALAFLSLFFFIDFVDELEDVGRRGYTLPMALLSSLLEVPGHLYELMPIAVLIGTIYSMARMAQSSEYTILRTGGLGPGRALSLLAVLGVVFAVITFVVGDFVVPASEREAVRIKTLASGGRDLGSTGAWLRERHSTPQGVRQVSLNVQRLAPDGTLENVRIFEFDEQGRLLERIAAARARIDDAQVWTLQDAQRTAWPAADAAQAPTQVQVQRLDQLRWQSSLGADVVAAAVLPIDTMSTLELWRYAAHLSNQEQAAQRHAIRFWRKAVYPFACLVMVALALPFAYLHARAGGLSYKVFGGIMLGISFVLLNNVAGHLGLLREWTPWLTAAAPSIFYLLLSLAAFTWLVRYR